MKECHSEAEKRTVEGEAGGSPVTEVGGRRVIASETLVPMIIPDGNSTTPDIAIAFYPSAAAMLAMLGDSAYKAAHVHRVAGLARTRLLATQPLAGV